MILQIKNGDLEKFNVTSAFDGLVIGCYTEAEDGLAIASADLLNPHLVDLKLTNKKTGVVCWDLTLIEACAVFNAGRSKLNHLNINGGLEGVELGALSLNGVIKDYSFPLPVYHGVYELEVNVNSGAFPSTSDLSSYLTVRFDRTTEAMNVETIVTDHTIDKRTEDFTFNGCAQILLMDTSKMVVGTATVETAMENLITISDVNYKANEESESMGIVDAIANSLTHCEEPNDFEFPQIIVHKGHLLTNGKVTIEGTNTDDLKLYTTEWRSSVTSVASAKRQQMNQQRTFSSLD